MSQILIKKLVKKYGQNQVVHGIDLEIKPKEFVVLVGPSGCGKSTTLRMIAGLEEISSGEIQIGNKVVNNLAPKDRNIAMVFQNYALYPHMSVRENLSFALQLQKMDRKDIDRRVRQAAEILGLMDLLERRPGQLSGGQRQRVAMGRAIVRNTPVFLFDEPLSNLDAKLRNQMRTEIKKLHMRMGTTIVYVTHDQVEAMTLADRIVVMKDGYIQQIGSPLEIYRNPANAFVAGFIGSPPTNLIEISGQIIGMRPEHIRLEAEGLSNPVGYQAQVEVLEPLGGETLVHTLVLNQKVIVKCEGLAPVRPSQVIQIYIDKENQRFFDKTSGKALNYN